ncbi:MAG: NAD(P)-binding protein [Candidatus Omnitrophica bacterium]|jgi:L-2-hydroxyglutarate oxidase LhgO|nr:NAD(P)-binding protein [Candidatus Omnitrophota bacterium]
MEKADITIIGSGVVGLSEAARISKSNYILYVPEKNHYFGGETSSRNKETIKT